MNGTMNKKYYKSAFSKVCPSEEAIERMLCMTETRKKTFRHKGLIIVLAVIAALVCGTFTVNATTDGKLFGNIRVILNGEEVNPEDHNIKCKAYVDEEGRKIIVEETYNPDGTLQGGLYSGFSESDIEKGMFKDVDKLLEGDVGSFKEDKNANVDVNITDITTADGARHMSSCIIDNNESEE